MTRIISSILFILFLSGCAGTFTKTQNIVSFANVLVAETPNVKINIPDKNSPKEYNINKSHIALKDIQDKQKWNKLSLPSEISAQPTIDKDVIYILCANGSVHAFDVTSSKKLWETYIVNKKSKVTTYGGGITIDDSKLYITNGSQNLVVLNAKNGRKITSRTFSDIMVQKPYIKGNYIYVLTLNNQLFSLAKNGFALMWDHAGTPEKLTYGRNHSSLVFDYKGRIFVSYSSGQLFLLDSEKGDIIWNHDLSFEQNMPGMFPVNTVGKPILEKNFAYLADSSGKIYKFDFEKDKIIWQRNILDIQNINKLGNAILLTTNGRQAAALNDKDGKIIWATDIVDDIGIIERQNREYREAEKYSKMHNSPKEKHNKPKGRIASIFSKLKNNNDTKSVSKPKILYDRTKTNPINFVRSVAANNAYQLYTAKGYVYYLSLKDGKIIDQRKLGSKLNYVTFGNEIIFASKKQVLYRK